MWSHPFKKDIAVLDSGQSETGGESDWVGGEKASIWRKIGNINFRKVTNKQHHIHAKQRYGESAVGPCVH